jgi:hypothetical protein
MRQAGGDLGVTGVTALEILFGSSSFLETVYVLWFFERDWCEYTPGGLNCYVLGDFWQNGE